MAHRRLLTLLTVGTCLLLLALTTPSNGKGGTTGRACEGLADMAESGSPASATIPGSMLRPRASSLRPCLPRYGDRKTILQMNETDEYYEAFPTPGDFNGDSLTDVAVTRLQFQTDNTFGLDILLNDGAGGMILATSQIFAGAAPIVQHPVEVIVADLNGDGRSDIFVANSGRDSPPNPGYQNALALSRPDGKLVNATQNLPQQNDTSHSACAADIDGDDDIDLYVGNYWGQNMIDPQILLNDGSGRFTVGAGRLPDKVKLGQNGYTTCAFADVNNDDSPDLVLGHYETISNSPTSEVLLNSGTGVFSVLPSAMPPKAHDPTDKAHDIAPLHLNDDGYVDLLVVYERQSDFVSYIQALINNGDGTFSDESTSRINSFYLHIWPNWRATSGNPRRTLELRDLDWDGDLDFLAKSYDYEYPDPLLFLNDGSGRFTWRSLDFGMRDADLYYAFVDLEGDGGQDIVLTLNFPPDYVEAIYDLGCPVFLPVVRRAPPTVK